MSTGCGSEQNAHAARQFPPARGTRGDTDFPPAAVCSPYNRTRLLLRSDPTGKHSSPKTRSQCHPHPQPRPHLHPCPQPHPCPHPREPNPSSQARTEALPEGPPGQHTDAPPGEPRSATPALPPVRVGGMRSGERGKAAAIPAPIPAVAPLPALCPRGDVGQPSPHPGTDPALPLCSPWGTASPARGNTTEPPVGSEGRRARPAGGAQPGAHLAAAPREGGGTGATPLSHGGLSGFGAVEEDRRYKPSLCTPKLWHRDRRPRSRTAALSAPSRQRVPTAGRYINCSPQLTTETRRRLSKCWAGSP